MRQRKHSRLRDSRKPFRCRKRYVETCTLVLETGSKSRMDVDLYRIQYAIIDRQAITCSRHLSTQGRHIKTLGL